MGAGGYLARYLIGQYLKANPAVETIDEMALIGSYAVQSAIDFDEKCGGEVEIFLVRKTGERDNSNPSLMYPGDKFIGQVQSETWRMLHDLAQMRDGLEPRSRVRIEEFAAEIKNKNGDFQWWFDRFPLIFDQLGYIAKCPAKYFTVDKARPDHGLWNQCNQFLHVPDVIREPRFHCWRNPQRLVDPAEVVMHVVESYGMSMVLHFLAESIGKPCKRRISIRMVRFCLST